MGIKKRDAALMEQNAAAIEPLQSALEKLKVCYGTLMEAQSAMEKCKAIYTQLNDLGTGHNPDNISAFRFGHPAAPGQDKFVVSGFARDAALHFITQILGWAVSDALAAPKGAGAGSMVKVARAEADAAKAERDTLAAQLAEMKAQMAALMAAQPEAQPAAQPARRKTHTA